LAEEECGITFFIKIQKNNSFNLPAEGEYLLSKTSKTEFNPKSDKYPISP